jgi:lysophospholipase L1-like esterase
MKKVLFSRVCLLLILSACLVVPAWVAAQTAENDAVNPVARNDDWWQNRHKAMNERVAQGNVDLLMIGDSITQGWEGNGKDVWEKYYTPRNAVNLGIGGDRTQHVLWRLQNGNLQGIEPKLAVLMIGTNNAGANTSEQIAEGIAKIVELLRKEKPNMKVLILAIFPRGENNNDPARKINQGANEIVAELADNQSVFYLDIGLKFTQADGTLTRDIMPDLLHLSPAGYQIWAESIEPMVVQLMGEKKE